MPQTEPEISQNVSQQRTFFLLIWSHLMQGSTATKRDGVTNKRSTKTLKYTRNLFRKNPQFKGVLILDLKPLIS